ncbi:MAG: molecular chaperone Hsp90 [Bacilli bacterium]
MKVETRKYIEKECKELLKVSFACNEAKDVCKRWLIHEGSKEEDEIAKELIKELKEDVEPIEDLLKFANSKECLTMFGEEEANKFKKHANELLAKGNKYCDCPACTAALNIIKIEKDI